MGDDLALDFGSARTRLADERGTVIYDEPTVAAVDDDTGELLAFGEAAVAMGASAAGRVVIRRPVKAGRLVDLDLAEAVLAAVLEKAGATRFSRPWILAAVHVNETNVQRRALERALRKAGARQVLFIEQPVACAVGAGLSIEEPEGSMAVDIGAGTTDAAVLALGGVVSSSALDIGGDTVDEAIRELVARRHQMVIDFESAEAIKRAIGSLEHSEFSAVEVDGRSLVSGEVIDAVVSSEDISAVMQEVFQPVFDAVVGCISASPPDLANDLLAHGLVLGGGGGLVPGFDQRLAAATGVAVHVADDPESLAIRGAAQCLRSFDVRGLVSEAPRR